MLLIGAWQRLRRAGQEMQRAKSGGAALLLRSSCRPLSGCPGRCGAQGDAQGWFPSSARSFGGSAGPQGPGRGGAGMPGTGRSRRPGGNEQEAPAGAEVPSSPPGLASSRLRLLLSCQAWQRGKRLPGPGAGTPGVSASSLRDRLPLAFCSAVPRLLRETTAHLQPLCCAKRALLPAAPRLCHLLPPASPCAGSGGRVVSPALAAPLPRALVPLAPSAVPRQPWPPLAFPGMDG